MTTDQPTILKVDQLTPELLALLNSNANGPVHIITKCAVLRGALPGVGHCPACHLPVFADDPEGPVWTCPADLSEDNPHREKADERITEVLMERTGVFSNCGEDFSLECHQRMPMHSQCYDSAVLTY